VSGHWSIHPDDEERVATDMSRAIEALASEASIHPPVDFADRVMAAIATEPLPQPVRAFGVALLAGRLSAAAASVGDAWRVVAGGSTPLAVRVQSLALVLALTVASLAVAGGATVGAIGLLTSGPPPAPITTTPSPDAPVPSDPAPSQSPSPSPSLAPDGSPDASPAAEPTETPEAETPGGPRNTDGPRTSTPQPAETDDHGDGSGGDGSGGEDLEHSGPGSGSGSDDDHTPSPTATDDHSSGDD
jgi:hypothetical protein